MKDLKQEWLSKWDQANALFTEGKEAEAEALLAECARLSPETWASLGMKQLEEKDLAGAMRRFQEAYSLAVKPSTKAICLNNIGSVLADSGYRDKAKSYFERCISLYPWYPDSFANLGLCYKWRGELGQAEKWIDKALELNPLHQQAAFTKSLIQLSAGKMPEGWDGYESRCRLRGGGVRKLEIPWPEWDGTQKRVLVYTEQGIGDNLQMMRYAKVMTERGHSVQFITRKPLKSLAEWSGLFTKVYEIGEPFKDFDAHITSMSLPRVFRTTIDTIPLAEGYIPKPEPATIERGQGPNVGIFWCGAMEYKQNLYRSTNLPQWREVLEVPGATFHSLQVGDGVEQSGLFPQLRLYPTPEDYLETARRIAALDLVITIDTSVAHLAGAMGVPVWILIPKGNDFRWLLNREDSPWYRSARLFRNGGDLQWQPVFNRIANELRQHPLLH